MPLSNIIPPNCRLEQAELFVNPRHAERDYGPREAAVLDDGGFGEARRHIREWEGYAATPLHVLDGLARELGIASLAYKDEGGRFGLGSFKALGGAYAVERLVGRHGSDITVTCATDGNHGRSVAWGARRFGCRCVIYIHEHVSEGRRAAIEAFGAEVRRVAGTYDDSVRQAAADAAREGWIVVSDTSYPGYTEIPRLVMQGYGVMVEEALDQIGEPPTHIFVQGGVGGLAAAVCFRSWQRYGAGRPELVIVEPELAACILATARAGRLATVEIGEETIMAGLSCGEPSLIAIEVLDEGASAFMAVPDHAAAACMRLLARGVNGDVPVTAGESAVAGLAGLVAVLADNRKIAQTGIGPDSRVLLFGSEGATDPVLYERIVGHPPT
ncbi:MAG: diaminopropionate ammonia-lyase [Geminicoccaceae bacterium]|nr:diaminopropionate ammonia-lyase [Geminicoccaceae bacterium]